MKTIVYIAHPNVNESSSHQFLLSSGRALTDVTYVDLTKEYMEHQAFDVNKERKRLVAYDQIIFQFQLYWYQAPAIMKHWMDQVFNHSYKDYAFIQQLKNKRLGIVLIAGVKASAYQPGGTEGRVISDLLSPYEVFARHFEMNYLTPFTLHQFNYLTEFQKMTLMVRYACYLETGASDSFRVLQSYLINKLKQLNANNLALTDEEHMVFEIFIQQLSDQADEIDELYTITEEW
ncbi:NAD(P)H-dependent oxidoreductase [Fundicoccus culcitae]|uniref:NAD(P)H-dependent oxidoreductase n=1 Tax=Fundicoccus culcitae TaxID=2969821 RepID=A0ABY5P2T7_9LACT|nr:NAD(P)H-dependent oxidoreductase [Fundicoccus culcitae]UUX32911.1 NAD(P)H-dependent oxidoreductase [Fundicoccus culcitae]